MTHALQAPGGVQFAYVSCMTHQGLRMKVSSLKMLVVLPVQAFAITATLGILRDTP